MSEVATKPAVVVASADPNAFHKFTRIEQGDQFSVDSAGYLIISNKDGIVIAIYAANRWESVYYEE